jgi:hypothetical protein
MEFTVRVNVKGVLAVIAVAVLSVGSFVAGEHRGRLYERRQSFTPIVLANSDGTTVDGMYYQVIAIQDFCKANPNRAFISGSQIGSCTSDGQVPDLAGKQNKKP